MKAAYYTGNKRFTIESVQPVAPGEGEVQVGVAYCGICGTDLHVYHGAMDARVGTHRVIGHEMSGKISAIGEKVQGLDIGDPVVIRPLAACGAIDCKSMITDVRPLEKIGDAFQALSGNAQAMKSLIKCS